MAYDSTVACGMGVMPLTLRKEREIYNVQIYS